jgi:DNA-binding MarR family transcriptional regulator
MKLTPAKGTHPEEHVFLLLSQTSTLCKKMSERALRPTGLTLAEYMLLRVTQNTPGVTAGEVGLRMFSKPPSVAQLVKSAERKGMIERRADTEDIRRRPLYLTAKGSDTVKLGRKAIEYTLQETRIPDTTLHGLITHLTSLFSSLSPYGD